MQCMGPKKKARGGADVKDKDTRIRDAKMELEVSLMKMSRGEHVTSIATFGRQMEAMRDEAHTNPMKMKELIRALDKAQQQTLVKMLQDNNNLANRQSVMAKMLFKDEHETLTALESRGQAGREASIAMIELYMVNCWGNPQTGAVSWTKMRDFLLKNIAGEEEDDEDEDEEM